MMHYMPTTIVHETKQLVSYTTMDGCILFVFFPHRSVPNLHDDREPVMATFNWQWPAIRWPSLVAAGEGPTSLCPQRATAATCTNVTHHQLHAACYQLKA